MKIILGIDVGGSTTKIIGLKLNKEIFGTLLVKAHDQITSTYGAIGNFIQTYNLSLEDIEALVLTGVGSSMLKGNIYNLPTYRVAEFKAIGFGGLHLSNLEKALVVSAGTGTAYIRADGNEHKHIGGTGVGGGTLLGLSSKLIGTNDIDGIIELADKGDLSNVDLSIKELTNEEIKTLPPNLTASNFGKITRRANQEDMALGILNMVAQTIGMLAIFACRENKEKNIVVVGALSVLKHTEEVFEMLGELHNLNFIIPEHSIFATAIGAALTYFL